jgi:hypothetical protein
MRKRVTSILAGTLLSAIVLPVAVIAQTSGGNKIRFFSGLLDRDRATCVRTASGAMQEQKERIAELISLVERNDIDASLGGSQHIAITLLGRYRAKEAVPALARRLMYLPEFKPGTAPMSETGITQMYYPCAAALVEIGQPSPVIAEMTNKIQNSADADERNLAAWVIMQVQGSAQAMVTLDALRARGDGGHKERLSAAREYIDTFKPTYNHPKANLSESRPPLPPGL